MMTHDEETKKFFKYSSVMCVLAPRYASSKMSFIKQQEVLICVMDAMTHPSIDFFRDWDTVFTGDFHNPTFPSGTRAPRQSWHDLHCRIDGPAIYDVLINFEQRWRKATKWKEFAFLFKEGFLVE